MAGPSLVQIRPYNRQANMMYPLHGRVVCMALSLVVASALIFAYGFGDNGLMLLYSGVSKSSNVVQYQVDDDSCVPLGIHLALRTDVDESESTSMTVSFYLPYFECREARPSVSYGIKGKEGRPIAAHEVEPLHIRYTSRMTDNETILSDWVYHVELSGLQAGGREYWYRIDVNVDALKEVQEQSSKNWLFRAFRTPKNLLVGERHYFRTPPLLGSPTSFAIVGDVGDSDVSKLTIQGMEYASSPDASEYPVSLAIIAGDIAYADAEPWYWSRWFRHTEYLFQHLPLSVAAGNHEVECDIKTLKVFENYEMWFRMPNRREDERKPITLEYRASLHHGHCVSPTFFQSKYNYGNSFYSYRHGNVHVIVLNSYSPCTPGTKQHRWLRTELSGRVNRTVTPWVVVVAHHPIYTTFYGHARADDAVPMERLFNRYGVNLVFTGHDHGYMRSKSLGLDRQVDDTEVAPIYFIVGTGGSSEGPVSRYKKETLDYYTAARSIGATGFGQLTVYNATHALWEFHTNQNEKEVEDWYLRHIDKDEVVKEGEVLGEFKDKVVLRNHFV